MERRKAQILILCGCIFAFIIIIITLCLSFCGLKGTFVCPEDPDQFFSFDLLKYSRGMYDLSQLDTEWIVEKGKYTISSKTIVFSPIDENSIQSTKKYTFSKESSTKIIIDGKIYHRVSKEDYVNLFKNSEPIEIVFESNHLGETNVNQSFSTIAGEVFCKEIPTPTREGFIFEGWIFYENGKVPTNKLYKSGESTFIWEKGTFKPQWRVAEHVCDIDKSKPCIAQTCTVCQKETEAIPHSLDANCVCIYCSQTLHDFDENCKCSRCGKTHDLNEDCKCVVCMQSFHTFYETNPCHDRNCARCQNTILATHQWKDEHTCHTIYCSLCYKKRLATTSHNPNSYGVCATCNDYDLTSIRTKMATTGYYRHGKNLFFGEYPQARVENTSIISSLGAFSSSTWTKVTKYYYNRSGTTPTQTIYLDYYFIDKSHNGIKYRGLYFIANTYLPDGYEINTVYWFEYQPIQWTIIKEESKKLTLISQVVLDTQQFDFSIEVNNAYTTSTLRNWLNNDFVNSAFSSTQQNLLQDTTVAPIDGNCTCLDCKTHYHSLDAKCYCSICKTYIHSIDENGVCTKCNSHPYTLSESDHKSHNLNENGYCSLCNTTFHILDKNCYCENCKTTIHIIDENCYCRGCNSYHHTLDTNNSCSVCKQSFHSLDDKVFIPTAGEISSLSTLKKLGSDYAKALGWFFSASSDGNGTEIGCGYWWLRDYISSNLLYAKYVLANGKVFEYYTDYACRGVVPSVIITVA